MARKSAASHRPATRTCGNPIPFCLGEADFAIALWINLPSDGDRLGLDRGVDGDPLDVLGRKRLGVVATRELSCSTESRSSPSR
jgi:hypothetical protein